MVWLFKFKPKFEYYPKKLLLRYSTFNIFRSFSTGGRLPLEVVFHWRLSSIIGRLPLEIVFHWRSSSVAGSLPLEIVFHWMLSSIGGSLSLEVVFHWRSSSIGMEWFDHLNLSLTFEYDPISSC